MKAETETCSRCGGTGHYSYNPMHGTICFKCHGSGLQYTKRGWKQKQVERKFRTRKASDYKVGDVMEYEIVNPQSNSSTIGFCRIEEIEEQDDRIVLIGKANGMRYAYHANPNTEIQRGLTAAEKQILRGLMDAVI